MNAKRQYHIRLRGALVEAEVNATSPLQMRHEWSESSVTQFSIRTDQSGLVGLLRHLHGLGYLFLSVTCEEENGRTDP